MAEWVTLFAKLNKNVSAHEARLIFMQIDKNNVGSVSLAELIPVVFNKANKSQIKMITHYAGMYFFIFLYVYWFCIYIRE